MTDSTTPRQTTTSLELPTYIVERVERRLPRSEWETPEEYVTHVMEETLARIESETDVDDDFEPVNEREVKDRLESLGYLGE